MKAKKKRISIIDKHGNKVEHEIEEETKAGSSFATAMKYSNVGFYLITPLLGGLALGIFLDSFFWLFPSSSSPMVLPLIKRGRPSAQFAFCADTRIVACMIHLFLKDWSRSLCCSDCGMSQN
jgi:hypothetical protein